MSRLLATTFAMALLLLPAIGGGATSPATMLPWWGPTGMTEGFHIRIPVTVTNPHSYPLTNGPVLLEVDLAEKLIGAGWTNTLSGDRNLLQGFELDLDSIRVVAMTDLQPPQPGTARGQPLLVEPKASGDARYEVSSMVLKGSLDAGGEASFDERGRPLVTVAWRVPGTMAPGTQRHFILYLDSTTNGQQSRPLYEERLSGASLADLFWHGPGTTLYGYVSPAPSEVAQVHVIGLHDNTSVEVWTATASGTWQRTQPPPASPPNPAPVARLESRNLFVSTGSPVPFKLVSSKPVLAYGESPGFIPSTDGSLAGREFVFGLTHPREWEQDALYFSATGSAPTTIVVEPVPNPQGLKFTHELNNNTNPYPHSISHRDAPFAGPGESNPCTPKARPFDPPALPGPGTFRATVVVGEAVLLQLAPSDALQQIPTALGAPVGTRFSAVTGWRDQGLTAGDNPSCIDTSRNGVWYAGAAGAATTLKVTSLEREAQIDPPGTTAVPTVPPRPVGAAPFQSVGPHPASFPNRPLTFDAAAPVWLLSGLYPRQIGVNVGGAGWPHPHARPSYESGPVPVANGPLGGDQLARNFHGIGRAVVFAPFNDTAVKIQAKYLGSGEVVEEFQLSADGVRHLSDLSASDRLFSFRLEATRPVIVYPTTGASGVLAGVPAFLDAAASSAQYRGFLLEVSAVNGLDPLTGSTLAGTPITYNVRVKNRALDVDGRPYPDTVDLTAVALDPAWQARLDRTSLALGGDQFAEFKLTVTPPAGAPQGSLGVVTVTATSRGNPQVEDSLDTVTFLKRSYDVGIWFERAGGRKSISRVVPLGNETDYPIIVQNRGSVSDVIRLETTNPDPGWDAILLKDGRDVEEVRLAPLETTEVTLRVVPPAAGDGLLVTTVTATSTSSPAALDRVASTTKLRAPSELRIDVASPSQPVDPGREAVFPILLRNIGAGTAEAVLELHRDAAGWGTPVVFLVEPASGRRVNITRLSLAGGEEVRAFVGITAPANATSGDSAELRLAARLIDRAISVEAFLYANVRAVHQLESTGPTSLPWDATRPNATVTLRWTNRGNLDEHLRINVENLPAGWKLTIPDDVILRRDQTQVLQGRLEPLPDAKPGTYTIVLEAISDDGHIERVQVAVRVGAAARAAADALPIALATPGRTALVSFPVRNLGNVPGELRVESNPDEPWSVVPSAPQSVAPGATVDAWVEWAVPADAADGASQHRARLLLVPTGAEAATAAFVAEAMIDVGRADVSWVTARHFKGAAGTLVHATVENTGDREATQVAAELFDGMERLDGVVIHALPPGGHANLTLLAPAGHARQLILTLDADQTVVETDEADNALELDTAPAKKSPVQGFIATLMVAVFVAVVVDWRRIHR